MHTIVAAFLITLAAWEPPCLFVEAAPAASQYEVVLYHDAEPGFTLHVSRAVGDGDGAAFLGPLDAYELDTAGTITLRASTPFRAYVCTPGARPGLIVLPTVLHP